MSNDNIFFSEDQIYDCFVCGKKLHYSAILKCIVEVQGGEHVCGDKTTFKNNNLNIDFTLRNSEEAARQYEKEFYLKKDKENDLAARQLQEYNENMNEVKKRKRLEAANMDGKSWPRNRR